MCVESEVSQRDRKHRHGQTHRQADRQTDTDTQTHRHTHTRAHRPVGAAAHAVVAGAEAAANDDGELGHGGAGHSGHKLRTILGNTAGLVFASHHEACGASVSWRACMLREVVQNQGERSPKGNFVRQLKASKETLDRPRTSDVLQEEKWDATLSADLNEVGTLARMSGKHKWPS